MTRREARQAREAQEAAQARDQEAAPQQAAPQAAAPQDAPQPSGDRTTREADARHPQTPGPWTPPPAETPANRQTLAGLDFDSVVTGPVPVDAAGRPEPEPVGAAVRHEAGHGTAREHSRFEDPAHAIFAPLAEDGAGGSGGGNGDSPLAWRQQNYVSHEQPKRKRRLLKRLVITLVVILVLGGLAAGGFMAFQPQVAALVAKVVPQNNDYTGNGTGSVTFTIKSGDDGSSIATNLQKAGVTKSYDAFYSLVLRQQPQIVWQPGVFKLAKQMSAKAALTALQDPASRMQNTAVIPEGTAEKDALQTVADATKIPLAQLQQAAANPADFGLPPQAKTLEGFLFPATYTFAPGISAHDALKTMVDRSFQALDQAGVPAADRWNDVILASIVQREAGLKDDYPKVARVFLNRLAQGWDLQSDATVAYGTGHTDRVATTDAERADASNPYNTYAHAGLPVGPISNPGDLALNAVTHPADGPWMYFVTWNLKTGETIFSTTQAEHEAAVAKWQQWMKDNPGYE
ncbi:endolytic transglycosylase MltG [Leifsonia shinshuensis]|uniref:Endolytic murein transglycosylase n=2 Tax=Leifsonia shinshuensis TaxID=150026 RepID=A0A7G6YG78_9MICO|nr:endolytic transglycosylase MltG [Leifsonia shinshuensis]